EKLTLLKMLLQKPTNKLDEKGIVRILNSAKDINELKTLVDGAGKSVLASEVDDPKFQKIVESKIFQVERAEAPPWPSGNAKTIDADLENLEKFLKQRIKTYDGLASGADKSARFKRFYSDLEKTAKEDLAALKNWKSLAGWEKQMLYGQIAHEIHVELK